MEEATKPPSQLQLRKHLLMNQVGRILAGVFSAALLFYFVPLFHAVPLTQRLNNSEQPAFDSGEFVEKFWSNALFKASQSAAQLSEVLQAINHDPQQAAQRYGKRLGLSAKVYYLVQGRGSVVQQHEEKVLLQLDGDPGQQVTIEIGPIFSNAVRDASGLLRVSQFANTQQFNAISAQINLKIEQQVLPKLQYPQLAPGNAVHFSAALELDEKHKAPNPLTLIPVSIKRL